MYILSCVVFTSITYVNMQNPGDKIIADIKDGSIPQAAIDDYSNSEQLNICRLLTLCLAILLTGNIMDNITGYEREVVVCLDLAMVVALILWAAAFKHYTTNLDLAKISGDPNQWASAQRVLHMADYLNYIIAGA